MVVLKQIVYYASNIKHLFKINKMLKFLIISHQSCLYNDTLPKTATFLSIPFVHISRILLIYP